MLAVCGIQFTIAVGKFASLLGKPVCFYLEPNAMLLLEHVSM